MTLDPNQLYWFPVRNEDGIPVAYLYFNNWRQYELEDHLELPNYESGIEFVAYDKRYNSKYYAKYRYQELLYMRKYIDKEDWEAAMKIIEAIPKN